jgi:hypothetical protein
MPKIKYIKAWGPLGRRCTFLLPFIGTQYVQTKLHEGLRTSLPGLQACVSLFGNTEIPLCLNQPRENLSTFRTEMQIRNSVFGNMQICSQTKVRNQSLNMFALLFLGTRNPFRVRTKSYERSRISFLRHSWTVTTNAFSTLWSSRIYNSWEAQSYHPKVKWKSWYRDSTVGIATGYELNDQGVGVRVLVGPRIFSSPDVQTGSGVHPTSYTMSTGKVKRQGREADNSPPTSVKIKKTRVYTATPPYVFKA